MRAINISNDRSRNAQVGFEQKALSRNVRYIREDGQAHRNVRVLKSTMPTNFGSLISDHGNELVDRIIASDPEIDFERVGLFLSRVKKVFLTPEGKVAYRVSRKHVFYSPTGEVKDERKYHTPEANINIELPLRWTGKLIPKDKAARMFVFTRGYQLRHINGLTFDFLYDMAKKLHDQNSVMLLGAGSKGAGPVVLSTGGTPYRAFIEGRIDGDKYCLILHLTKLELKPIYI